MVESDNFYREKLILIARKKMKRSDPSHDINHVLRVLCISEKIAAEESADMEIIVPAAIFHDVICYPKNHRKRFDSQRESAIFAVKTLKKIKSYPIDKIKKVQEAIELCSFSKGQIPSFIEAKILQDADSLEAMGSISIMRTFSSAGIMNKIFYNSADPFCRNRKPDDKNYALDLFFSRLLVVENRLHTKTAKTLAEKRMPILKKFLESLDIELSDI